MKKQIALLLLNYLRLIAKAQLLKIRLLQQIKGKSLKVVGITGSAGKSSVLYILEAILKPELSVKTNLLYNSESGIPLNILGLKVGDYSLKNWVSLSLLAPTKLVTNWQTYDVYLVEMGIDEPDEPKNMSYLLKIIKPDISIFLNVTPVHSLQFDKTVTPSLKGEKRLEAILKNIAKEKAKIITNLPQNAIGIINSGDQNVVSSTKNSSCQLYSVGTNPTDTLRITKTTTGPQGLSVCYHYQNQTFDLNLSRFVLPQAYAVSIGCSLLAALKVGVSLQQSIANLSQNLRLPPGRSTLLKGLKNSLIIDSSYNSSLLATSEMLDLLSSFPSPRIAVLGDLRETGDESEIIHSQIFSKAKTSANLIIGVGPETQKYFAPSKNCLTFTYWWQAADYLTKSLPPKASILVKGSQNTIFLEEIVKKLLKNPKDSKLLCRQSLYWQTTKKKFFMLNQTA